MSKTLFISDLDGTLLGKNAELSEESARMLNEAYKKGLNFAVATARTAATVDSIMKNAAPTVPSVMQNGVSVYDIREKKYIKTETIAENAALSVIKMLEESGACPFIYTGENGMKTYYTELKNQAMKEFVDDRIKKFGKEFTKTEIPEALAAGGITYFAVMDCEHTVMTAVEKIKATNSINFTYYKDIYDEKNWYLEIFADTASKKHGVEFLRKEYGFEKIVCFGDNLNDLAMFDAADVKIAVENANEKVKAAADTVIGKNTEDSVARYILENMEN